MEYELIRARWRKLYVKRMKETSMEENRLKGREESGSDDYHDLDEKTYAQMQARFEGDQRREDRDKEGQDNETKLFTEKGKRKRRIDS